MKLRPWNSRRHQRGFLNPPPFIGAQRFECDSADFDGSNDYLLRTSALSGMANSKTGIFSAWFRLDGGDGADATIFAMNESPGGDYLFEVLRRADNTIHVWGGSPADLFIQTTATYTAGSAWHHLLAAWDLNSNYTQLYVDGVNDINPSGRVANNQNIVWAALDDTAVGADWGGGNKFHGCLAEIYLAPGQFLDITSDSVFRCFNQNGRPQRLGATGSIPTGVAPAVYLHLDKGESAANFAINRAGNGDFTVTGTLATGSTSPSD